MTHYLSAAASVESSVEKRSLGIDEVEHRPGVVRHRSGEDDRVVVSRQRFQEWVEPRPLVHLYKKIERRGTQKKKTERKTFTTLVPGTIEGGYTRTTTAASACHNGTSQATLTHSHQISCLKCAPAMFRSWDLVTTGKKECLTRYKQH